MIARWWRGWAETAENAAAYEELLTTSIFPWVAAHGGHRGSYLRIPFEIEADWVARRTLATEPAPSSGEPAPLS